MSESPTNVIMFWNPFWSPGLDWNSFSWPWKPGFGFPFVFQMKMFQVIIRNLLVDPNLYHLHNPIPKLMVGTANQSPSPNPWHLPHVLRLCLQQFRWVPMPTQDGHQVVDLQTFTALQVVFVQTLVWQQLWKYSFPRVGQVVNIWSHMHTTSSDLQRPWNQGYPVQK